MENYLNDILYARNQAHQFGNIVNGLEELEVCTDKYKKEIEHLHNLCEEIVDTIQKIYTAEGGRY